VPQTASMRHTNPSIQFLICSLIIGAVPLCGAVKMQVVEGRPIVGGVYVNGHGPYRFLVDTGANVNLIETGLARKIGMDPTFKVDFVSASGKTQMSGSDDNEVTLDPVKAPAQRFLFSRLEALHILAPDVQGILGQWFLARFDYAIELSSKRLEFGKQERNGTRVKFTMQNGRMLVPSSLGDLMLDSGASRLVLFGVDSDGGSPGRVRTLTGTQAIGMVRRKLVIEARNVWHGDAVTMRSRTEPGVAGLLPLGLFKAAYVCNSEGYVVFE
jgi:hypothetical protein